MEAEVQRIVVAKGPFTLAEIVAARVALSTQRHSGALRIVEELEQMLETSGESSMHLEMAYEYRSVLPNAITPRDSAELLLACELAAV
ncbi:MAG: hypothetical protein ABR582_14715 [Gemmatimonadaceae bacterium]